MLAPFECLCGNFILPEPASYVFFYAFFNLRKLLYIIELLGGEKLPKMDVLKEKRRQLAARKKALYLEYRKAQQDMRELVAVKGSVDHLRGLTDNQRNKEQAR